MTKIRVNKSNSKVVDGKLFITLLKAMQIKSTVLQRLINYTSSIKFPGVSDRMVQYNGPYIRINKHI